MAADQSELTAAPDQSETTTALILPTLEPIVSSGVLRAVAGVRMVKVADVRVGATRE